MTCTKILQTTTYYHFNFPISLKRFTLSLTTIKFSAFSSSSLFNNDITGLPAELNSLSLLELAAWTVYTKWTAKTKLRLYFRTSYKSKWNMLVRAACMHCHETKCPLLTAFFLFSLSFFLSLCPGYFFLKEVLSHTKNKIWGEKKFGGPPLTVTL